MRVGDLRFVLRLLPRGASGDLIDDSREQRGSAAGEIVFELLAGLVGADWTFHPGDHAAGIERLHDAHDRHAGHGIAGDDRAMDRRGAAVLRQQRRVDVDHPEPGDRQHLVGQDPAVGGDDAEVGVPGPEGVQERGVFHLRGLEDRQSRGDRACFHRRVRHLLAAAARPIGLGDDAGDGVRRRREQRLERRDRELGRAKKDDLDALHHLPARVSL